MLSKRARDGCHKVQWTLALARPRGALALREIEPKLPSSWVSRSAPHFSDNKKGLPIRKSFLLSKRARDGCHKVRWTLVLARPRSALALREIEPKLPNSWVSRSARTSRITKKDFQFGSPFCYLRERETGIEPATPSLARRCSTTEPLAHIIYCVPCEHK